MKPTLLVAPLNWGLGHATRCIPIINELQNNGFQVVIASDGGALELLQKEFPLLQSINLPSYAIRYSKKAWVLKWKLLFNSWQTLKAIKKEKEIVAQAIEKYAITGIVSDSRLGVFSNKIPSVIITHQLKVLSGNTTWLSSRLHTHFLKKFAECWVPDSGFVPNLSGKMGHVYSKKITIKYIGVLSRFTKKELPKKYDLMVLLSGPEPQRSILEEKLSNQLANFDGCVLFVKGIVEDHQKFEKKGTVLYCNFMQTKELEQAFNESEIVLCRSGYSTIMDLCVLQKKALFIPTPGQPEQLYLAGKLKREGHLPRSKQESFKPEDLLAVPLYKGLPPIAQFANWSELFMIFRV